MPGIYNFVFIGVEDRNVLEIAASKLVLLRQVCWTTEVVEKFEIISS